MKKKLTAILLCVVCAAACVFCFTACSKSGTKGLKYTLNADGQSYSVTGIGTATSKKIVIASEHLGKPVTEIGYLAFGYCENLTSIEIPNSILEIGGLAFFYCENLTSIEIPNSVTNIGHEIFGGCSSLTSITVADGNTKYHSAGNCIIETESNTLILGCSTSVIPADGSVTCIGSSAFSDCSNLKNLEIPNSVTSIGNEVFSGCSSLTSITVADGNTKYHSAGDCLIETESKKLLVGCKSSVIPTDGSVTNIVYKAFFGCSGLTNIVIPNSITNIGGNAFGSCESLSSITIPNSVTSIGDGAFSGCSSLTSITVADENAKYHSAGDCLIETESKKLIAGCSTSVIPADGSVTSICDDAFSNRSGLKNITIPNSVTRIGRYAFWECISLTSITIPSNVTSIGENAFSGCSSLTSITVANGNTKYHSEGNCIIETESKTLISGCAVSVIPDDGSVTSIGESAFEDCYSLIKITIPNSITSIGRYAFAWCESLINVMIPSSVTRISEYAFNGCESLTIHAAAEEKPDGWDEDWNPNNCPVVWGYKG